MQQLPADGANSDQAFVLLDSMTLGQGTADSPPSLQELEGPEIAWQQPIANKRKRYFTPLTEMIQLLANKSTHVTATEGNGKSSR